MRYLTVRESAKLMRQAGLTADERQLRRWAESGEGRDVWILGRHLFIYEGEVRSLIDSRGGW